MGTLRGSRVSQYQLGYLQALEDVLHETDNRELVPTLTAMRYLVRHMIDDVRSE